MKVAPGDGVLDVDALAVMAGGCEAMEEDCMERGTGNDVSITRG